MLGIDITVKRRVSKRQERKGKNGRKGWTKMPVQKCREYLTAKSNPTCHMYIGRGKRKAGAAPEVLVKRALTDTKRQLLKQSEFKDLVSQATWYRQLRACCPEMSANKRKLDMCTKCHQWDESVRPACLQSLVSLPFVCCC